ncbi:RNA polymerase sigma-70 factor [Seonamhaeicola sp.]|uniref:RNA polymerase sigma-70 factor n=1 Tax=Seonamhaeicola sp. TaxID=1912245 RepID=UPI002639C7EA|nr:RNA polymerase sigma-70 factor [Seonamhaeicola sp.]
MIKEGKYDEKLLVKELSSGNEKAFKKLFDIYYQDIYVYSKSIIKSTEFAEGIVQDTFLKVWLNRENIDPKQSFKSYLYTIAKNHAFNFLQKAANNKKLREEIFYKGKRYANAADRRILEADIERIKNEAISQLPPKRRLIFEMSRYQGKSYKEISEELGISISTVKSQMSKALETLRHLIQVHGDMSLIIALFFFNR